VLIAVAVDVGSGVNVAVDVGSRVDVAVGAAVFVRVGTGVSVGLLVGDGVMVDVLWSVSVAVGSGVCVGAAVGSGVQVSVCCAVGLRVGATASVTGPTRVAGVERGETRVLIRALQPSNMLISTAARIHLQANDHRRSHPVALLRMISDLPSGFSSDIAMSSNGRIGSLRRPIVL
jgi:hypothetical protein